MNNSYYETLDKNFMQALKLYETNFSHEELLDMMKNGNIPQKQIAVLKLDTISSIQDAQILVSNLTGQDGKIREAVSMRLAEFMSDDVLVKYFYNSEIYNKFLDAVTDINGNICRNVLTAISNLRSNEEFCKFFCNALSGLTSELLDIVENFNFQEGKYKINKEAFKLYWCLEAIYIFYDKMDFDDLRKIILRAKKIDEYTIREKAAKILSHKFEDPVLKKAREELQNDKNYYVRRF